MIRRLLVVGLLVGWAGSVSAQEYVVKAKAALAAKDTAGAITQLELAVKNGQKAGEAHYYLGAVAFARKKYPEALEHAQAAVKANDENVDALKLLAEAQLKTKNAKGAIETLKRAEKLAKKDPVVLALLGRTMLEDGQVDEAIRYLSLAKEYMPNEASIYVSLGDAYLKQNVAALGISSYQKAIEVDPRDFATRYKLAELFERQRQYSEAVKEYDGVIGVDSTYADAYLAKGRILVRAKQYQRAVPSLRKFVEVQPKSVEGNNYLARALYGSRDYKEAAAASKKALQLDSSNTDVWRAYAESCVETGDFATGVAAFEALKRRNAFKPEDNSSYGTALFRLGKEEEALKSLLSAVTEDSTNCDPYASLGVIYMKRQDYASAAVYFEKKIACTPTSLSSYVNAAACYMQVKNFPRTRELLTKAVDLKPDFLQGRLWLGRYFAQVDSLEMAKAQYDEVLKIVAANPDKYKKEAGEAYQQIGQYYFVTKQFDRVVDAMRRAVQAGQENSGVHLMWGQAGLQLLDPQEPQADGIRKKEEAVRHFRKAIELDPNSPSAHLWLAQGLIISRVEGDNKRNKELLDEACTEYRKVLKLDPKNADAQKGMTLYGCK